MKHIGLYRARPDGKRTPVCRPFRLKVDEITTYDERVEDLDYLIPTDGWEQPNRLATTYEVWGSAAGLPYEFRVGFIARLKFNERIGESSWWGLTERQAMLSGHFWELHAGHQDTAREEVANLFAAEARLYDECYWREYCREPFSFQQRLEHFLEYLTPLYLGQKVQYRGDMELSAGSEKALLLNAIASLPTFLAETRGYVEHPETLYGYDRELEDLDFLADSLTKFHGGVLARRERISALAAPLRVQKDREDKERREGGARQRAELEEAAKARSVKLNDRSLQLTGKPVDEEGPSPEKLKKLVWEMPLRNIGARFGISDVMAKKYCKKWNILTPPQGFFLMSEDKKSALRLAHGQPN